MIISITPNYEADLERLHEYLGNESRSYRLGQFGRRQGQGARMLLMKDPVELAAVRNLHQGKSPDGSRQMREPTVNASEMGWRMTFTAPPSMTVLWALAPQPVRDRLEESHFSAVYHALNEFEASINGWDWHARSAVDLRHDFGTCIFAKFQSGATYDQKPRLQTDVLLFNMSIHGDGSVGMFENQQVFAQKSLLERTGEEMLEMKLRDDIGAFTKGNQPGLSIGMVPDELVGRFVSDPAFTPHKSAVQRTIPLKGHELFAAWQAQAEELGWDPREADHAINISQKRGDVRSVVHDLRAALLKGRDQFYRTPESVRTLGGTESPQLEQPQTKKEEKKSKGHGHSH